MSARAKWLDYLMWALAALLGIGSIVLFVAMSWTSFVEMGWSDPGVLVWDTMLSFAFFLQHSGMVRRRFRASLSGVIPKRFEAAFYAIASGVVLALVAVLWQRSQTHVLVLEGTPLWVARALTVVAVAVFVRSAVVLGTLFDPLGIRPIKAHLSGAAESPSAFVVKGPYRWVRHPLYSCVALLFWCTADVTADRLLFNVLWTGWICIATVLEERDLVADFGDAYRDYQRKVPMLVPWRGRAAT